MNKEKKLNKASIEWIPENWEVKTIDEISSIKTGPFGTTLKASEYSNCGGVPLISVREIRNGYLKITEHTPRISNDVINRLPQYVLRKGDIVFGRKGAIERSALIRKQQDGWFLGSDGISVRPSIKYHEEFIAFQFQSDRVQNWLIKNAIGSTMLSLNQKTLGRVKVLIPPLYEQVKIAQVLSSWDKAITQTQQLIEAKQKLKRGLMQQLLTGKVRFPEFGEPTKNDQLPKDWKALKIEDCFKERKESAPDLPLLSITSSRGVIYRGDVDRKDTSNADKSKYKKIVPGDIGYNTMRMWQGVSAVSELEGIVSPAYTVCQPRKNVHSDYFGYLFKYPPMVNMFHRHSQGLVSDTLNLKFPLFSKILVFIPPFDEQVKIAQCLSKIEREIEQLEKQTTFVERQKQGLMQKLLTGQIRVHIKEN